MRKIHHIFLVLLLLAWEGPRARAFALLGPYTPWMTPALGYGLANDIGGPMQLGNGYRWNVPVVTYGFDPSFTAYFGTNGVAAVEGAIQILNALPPASSMNLTNFPLDTIYQNPTAYANGLVDVKTTALHYLVEQMGLGQPSRSAFSIRAALTNDSGTGYAVVTRNFDPTTLEPVTTVDGVAFFYVIFPERGFPLVLPEPTTLLGPYLLAVADVWPDSVPLSDPGAFYTGLTADDAGGLGYLLSATNMALESLIPGATGIGTNQANYVSTALRPGVEKLSFQPHEFDAVHHQFLPMTIPYLDSYVTNNTVQTQTLARVVLQPDILFTAVGDSIYSVTRSGTSSWVNNGGVLAEGPGVIQPPIQINFTPTGPALFEIGGDFAGVGSPVGDDTLWASYNGTTNQPVLYPINPATTNSTTFQMLLLPPGNLGQQSEISFSWNLEGQPNARFLLQSSTNLSDWATITAITNLGWSFSYVTAVNTNAPALFFRTIPE